VVNRYGGPWPAGGGASATSWLVWPTVIVVASAAGDEAKTTTAAAAKIKEAPNLAIDIPPPPVRPAADRAATDRKALSSGPRASLGGQDLKTTAALWG
jgi:hypothetical protein